MKNVEFFALMELWPDGDVVFNEMTFLSWGAAINHLWAMADHGRTIEAIRLSYDERGLLSAEPCTDDAGDALAERARLLDNEDYGIPSFERPHVHPLAFDPGGFSWTPNASERRDMEADAWRDGKLSK